MVKKYKMEVGMGKHIAAFVATIFIVGMLYIKIKFNLWLPPKLIPLAVLALPPFVTLVAIIRRLFKR